MISTRDLVTLIAAGVVLGALGCANAQRRREREAAVQRREDLQTWEGEGGAVPAAEQRGATTASTTGSL